MNRFGLNPDNPNFARALWRNYRFRLRVGPERFKATDIPEGKTETHLKRRGKSHQGIGQRTELTALAAESVDQDFLDEIGMLTNLEHLDLRFPMRATDISPLLNLTKLKILQIDGISAIEDFSVLTRLPSLEVLMIEQARKMRTLDWVRPLKDQLIVLGIEGSAGTTQRLETLAPLEGFALEALFLISTSCADRSIEPIFTMPNLRALECAQIAPPKEFDRLQAAKPDLVCNWFSVPE